jgi:LPS-assembly lipoprotein
MLLSTPAQIKYTLIVLMTLSLSACGFHFRGDYDIPIELNSLSVTSYDQYSSFTRIVKKQLRINDVDIVTPDAHIPNLHLSGETISTRTLSIYQNTRAAETELTLTATYRVTIPDVGDQNFTTSVTRSYLENSLTALAKSVEKTMIIDEMRKLTATQIVRQMARLKNNFNDPDAKDIAPISDLVTTVERQTTEAPIIETSAQAPQVE